MAQDPVVRKAVLQCRFEGVHVVDTLADEGPLLEDVLVNVRDCVGIGIDARIAAIEACIRRRCQVGQAHRHPGLQDAVAAGYPARRRVELRLIERMGHRADQLPGGFPRQVGVGVQRDDVPDAGERRQVAHHAGKRVRALAAEQAVQIGQLSSFSFVGHPDPFLFVPVAGAVAEVERAASQPPILLVQGLDLRLGALQQQGVGRQMLRRRVREIRQQAEAQVVPGIRQEADLQRFGERVRVIQVDQHRGDGDQAAGIVGDALGVIHARQAVGAHQPCQGPVDGRHGEMAGGQNGQQGETRDGPEAGSRPMGHRQQQRADRARQQDDGARIQA
ncbi:hypothetical protein D3C87_1120930 [compost metagenome]